MKKTSPHTLQAQWGELSKKPTWECITSATLAKVLGVHLQTINNWKIRGILPPPVTDNPKLRGNKNYYRIAAIRAWLEGKTSEQIHDEWVAQNMVGDSATPAQIRYISKLLMQAS